MYNCNKNNEVCKHCLRCISYNTNYELVNEVEQCKGDTVYLNMYSSGFIDASKANGRNAICLKLGIKCEFE